MYIARTVADDNFFPRNATGKNPKEWRMFSSIGKLAVLFR